MHSLLQAAFWCMRCLSSKILMLERIFIWNHTSFRKYKIYNWETRIDPMKFQKWTQPVWLIWLSTVLQTKRSLVLFSVRAHSWVAGSVSHQGTYRSQSIDVSPSHQCFYPSHSPSHPLSKIKNIFLRKVKKWTNRSRDSKAGEA